MILVLDKYFNYIKFFLYFKFSIYKFLHYSYSKSSKQTLNYRRYISSKTHFKTCFKVSYLIILENNLKNL